MRSIHVVLAIILLALIVKLFQYTMTQKEGFSYTDCMDEGYTKAFCSQRAMPGLCQCPNGLIGRIDPNFGGACVCSYYTPPVYPIPMIF